MQSFLLVDSDPGSVKDLQVELQRRQHLTVIADGGGEALAWLREFTPDAILIGVGIEAMDAIAFLEMLRADPQPAGTRIIVYTKSAAAIDLPRLAEVQVGEMLIKGVVPI